MGRLRIRLRLLASGCCLALLILEYFHGADAETDNGHQSGTRGETAEQGAFVFLFVVPCSDYFMKDFSQQFFGIEHDVIYRLKEGKGCCPKTANAGSGIRIT
ncbi:MAG: hypothetical protein ACD_75C01002G0004 [uncultured bacterium]|nr:MAG: hypothetical protein ACD_75C01002G0004 [uncultured bacterium]